MSDDHAEAIGVPSAMALAGDPPLRMPEVTAPTPSPESESHSEVAAAVVEAAAPEVAEAAPVDAAAATSDGADTIEGIRARLAARGLLATSPRIVVPKAPRADDEGSATVPTLATFAAPMQEEDEADNHWAESDADETDVEPGLEEVTVRCPQCREVYFRPLESTRFACPTCDRSWRFAICEGCDALAFTIERQESWRCGSCGHHTRSWWRTPTAPKTAVDVVARRKHQAVQEERRLVREGMKKRRWKLIALAAWAAVFAIAIVVGVRMAEPSVASGSDVTCRHFAAIRGALASGTLDRRGFDRELDTLALEAQGATEDIHKAVSNFRAATPGTSEALIARTTLADACDAHTG